jgi:hypothetical protein
VSFQDDQGRWQSGCQRALEDLVERHAIEPLGQGRVSQSDQDAYPGDLEIFDALPDGHSRVASVAPWC